MFMSRLLALLATSTHITPVIRMVGGCLGSSAPKVHCGIFEREPVGIVPVGAERKVSCAMSPRKTVVSHQVSFCCLDHVSICSCVSAGMPAVAVVSPGVWLIGRD